MPCAPQVTERRVLAVRCAAAFRSSACCEPILPLQGACCPCCGVKNSHLGASLAPLQSPRTELKSATSSDQAAQGAAKASVSSSTQTLVTEYRLSEVRCLVLLKFVTALCI